MLHKRHLVLCLTFWVHFTSLRSPTSKVRSQNAAHTQMDGVEYHAIVNVGTNPTIGNDHITIEAHIIDYKGDLYGKLLAISFVRFLRAEQKFASISALQLQIQRDIQSL